MKKTYCDICEVEIKDTRNNYPLSFEIYRSGTQVTFKKKYQDVCTDCRKGTIKAIEIFIEERRGPLRGVCPYCGEQIKPGDVLVNNKTARVHLACWEKK